MTHLPTPGADRPSSAVPDPRPRGTSDAPGPGVDPAGRATSSAAPAAAAQPPRITPRSLDLASGEPIEAIDLRQQAAPALWRVAHGALRIDAAEPGAPALSLLLAGDLLPIALLQGWEHQHRLRALVATRLVSLTAQETGQPAARLVEAMQQQWRRTVQMHRLRTGAVPDRIRRLMVLLAGGGEDDPLPSIQALRLPRVRDIADLVNSTPESVSRTMSALKRLDLVIERSGNHTRFDPERLSAGKLPVGLTRSVPLPSRLAAGSASP